MLLFFLILLSPFISLESSQQNKTILVVGGAGYIGSQVNQMLNQAGYETVVLDNLSTGSKDAVVRGRLIEGDLNNPTFLNEVFEKNKFDAVMHFAASIDVNESVKNPSRYYKNNVCNTIQLLDAMVKYSVKTIIFSSTAAIFGKPVEVPISESHPCHPESPYGHSKLMIEQILKDYRDAYGLNYSCLRYFNAAGGDPEGNIKNCKMKVSNLIPVALRAVKSNQPITVFGTDYATPDGTCIRDYVHIYDLGKAHLLAMENLLSGADSTCYNLGNGKGFSVKEVLNVVRKVTGKELQIIYGPRRKGDVSMIVADSSKAEKELGWTPTYSSLELMVEHAWRAIQ